MTLPKLPPDLTLTLTPSLVNKLCAYIRILKPPPFSGFALLILEKDADPDTLGEADLASNGYGLCLFPDKASLLELVELWRQSEKNREPAPGQVREFVDASYRIRPVRITVENGLEFTGPAEMLPKAT